MSAKLSKIMFVYGTLQSNKCLNMARFPGARFLKQSRTVEQQFDMVDFGAFPGVVFGGASDVQGELWEIDQPTLCQLDHIEGYPDFYNRRIVETQHGPALMYYLRRAPHGATMLEPDPHTGLLAW